MIIKTPWLPAGFSGMTIFNLILVKDLKNKKTIAHEQEHVKQQIREPILFYFKYLYYLKKYGYWNNPYEVAARKAGDNA